VGQNLPQPGQPFPFRFTGEPRQAAVGFEQRLLHNVGGVDPGPHPAFDLRTGDHRDVIAAAGEQRVACGGIAGTGPL
jgi:hypothetical protein